MGTFNKDLVTIVGHLHRIEADDFADSLLDRQVGEVTGHSEVFQFVVDEIDGLIVDGCIQVFKHLRQRLVMVLPIDFLTLRAQCQCTEQGCEYTFFVLFYNEYLVFASDVDTFELVERIDDIV